MQKLIIILTFILISLSTVLSQNIQCKVFLQGAYLSGSLMRTDLLDSIPYDQPYNETPWDYQGDESLNVIPVNMVDWVLLELRDKDNDTIIRGRRAALLLSDGNIVDTNLQSSVFFGGITPDQYYICIYHRNHIPVMSSNPVIVPNTAVYDFSDTLNFPPYGGGSNALIELKPDLLGMIAGDVNKDGLLKYSGPSNDRAAVLQFLVTASGSSNLITTTYAYCDEDINMNKMVKYSGPGNDPSMIIQNLLQLTGSNSITSLFKSPVPKGVVRSFQCGDTLIDKRDNKRYTTVQIGNNCWMSENLNVGNFILGVNAQSNNGIPEKYCYEDIPSNCDVYGGLYFWDEMMDYSSNAGSQGLCMDGWHIPTDEEWKILEGTVDSQYGVGDPHWDLTGNRGSDVSCKLKETGTLHWSIPNTCAMNTSGFTALPGGYQVFSFIYYWLTVKAYFWTSSQQASSNAWLRIIENNSPMISRESMNKNSGLSVRCVLD